MAPSKPITATPPAQPTDVKEILKTLVEELEEALGVELPESKQAVLNLQ